MEGEHNVGCRAIEVRDERRGLTITAWLLYPTRAPAAPHAFGPWELACAIDAPIDAPIDGERVPLVAVSHGNGASPWVHRDLIAHLVTSGFAVAALEHPGNSRGDNALGRADGVMVIENLERRPHHLRLVIDAAFARLGDRLAPGVGVIGTSIGGYTAAAIAGGRALTFPDDVDAAARRAPDAATLARLVPVAAERDPRVRAAVLLVPALTFFAAPGALAALEETPLLVRSGALDPICPPAQIAHALRELAQVDHVTVPGAAHFSFLSPFPAALASLPPASDPPGFDRAAYQPVLARDVTAFLREALLR